ncbi:MAG: beta-ketoacyl synthase N-terminal-like domain-containing protein [Capnocytophaga sp.]|nr:beta-ketoacyl synthase N-terminal-like domain-containing protein [Capnocytophaga sp.]
MCFVHSYNCITPLGFNLKSNLESLLSEKSAIEFFANFGFFSDIYLSKIDDDKINSAFSRICDDKNYSRLEKMLILALHPLLENIKINEKTVFILSTTKGNIAELQFSTQKLPFLSVLAKKIATFAGIQSEPIVISNACVSGAMALSIAKRLLNSGLYENALVVAGDEISEFVISGFQSFQAISPLPCRPYDTQRNGITLGEATAAMLLTTSAENTKAQLLGDSSINDANHISGPSRTGEGLFLSIQNAINQSNISANQIDIINAHGTATLYNDEMEGIAFSRADLLNVPTNSYKGYFGHTLGTSGLLETLLTIELSRQNKVLKSIGFEQLGISQPLKIADKTTDKQITYFLKTASGFGGCNTALVGKIL